MIFLITFLPATVLLGISIVVILLSVGARKQLARGGIWGVMVGSQFMSIAGSL